MQNKGIVICTAVLLTLASIFYLSFSVATNYYDKQASKIADPIAQQDYKDSVKYLGVYSYQKCLETQIGLGLDLKGGMNVILEISVPDVVDVLADHKTDAAYVKSMSEAKKEEETSQSDFISLFINAYHKNAPGHKLAEIFATQQLQGKVSPQSSDSEVEKVLREQVSAAIDNSFNVVRTRIDQFGVVQPNIQKLEGQEGRIMVEMPGIKEPERMRKLLQGSANLEFWETYNSDEIAPYLQQLDARMVAGAEADTTKAEKAEKKAPSKFQLKGVNKNAVVSENAAEKVEVLDPLIAYEDEEYCYIALNAIESGTILAKTDSDERYTVRLTAELEGVYKISKGFTEFCPVVVLDRTDDYILAAKNTRGGVSAYDAILLNAKGYTSGQILQ